MDDGELFPRGKARYGLFADVEHRADLRDAGAAEIRDRLEAGDAALVEQAHEERLDRVVIVVAQGNFIVALLAHQVVQRAAAHLCAHGAGVLLLAIVENDRADLRLLHKIGHVQPRAQLRHG